MSVGVYVHFPWCPQLCPYCDFVKRLGPVPHDAYADAVIAELALRAPALPPDGACTVYFGGGTPGMWDARAIARVIAAVTANYGAASEVTVECNPEGLDEARAHALREAGVTRVSVGVQSLHDDELRRLGRVHDGASALAAVRSAARNAGLRVTADLIFGTPGQSVETLCADADALLGAGARHLSCYALTIEPGTPFDARVRRGRLVRQGDDAVATMFTALDTHLVSRGLEHYEVSSYALPGERARHNSAYWTGSAYLGLGVGAVGCVPGGRHAMIRARNEPDVTAYLGALARGVLAPHETEELDAPTLVREGLMLGLRTRDGVDLAALRARTGLDARVGRERALAGAVARGNVIDEGDRWVIPTTRWLLADEITARLF